MENTDRAFLENYINGKLSGEDVVTSAVGEFLHAQIVEIDKENFKLSMRFKTRPEMVNGAGVIQGGQLTSMLDTGMAFCVLSHVKTDQTTSTISINTDFLNPTKAGVFIVEAEITRMGRSIAFAKSNLKDEGGTLIASATANLMVVG